MKSTQSLIRIFTILCLPTLLLLSGCGKKALMPLQADLEFTEADTIFEPGEGAAVSVIITNPDAKTRPISLPSPANTRIYASLIDADGNIVPKGSLRLIEDMGGGVENVSPGDFVSATMLIEAMPAAEGAYSLIAIYNNGAEAEGEPVYTNNIEASVE
jgi:hypothetical protein